MQVDASKTKKIQGVLDWTLNATSEIVDGSRRIVYDPNCVLWALTERDPRVW